jgi:CHAT domain-containing protein
MVPTRSGEKREPLGVEFTMARWVTGGARSAPQQIPLSDSYTIAPDYTRRKLKFAEAESKMVCEKFNGEPIKPASYENIRQRLQAKKVSLLHFACHGKAKDNDVEQTLLLDDDAELTLIELTGDDVFNAYFGSKQPFVFLNACDVGRQQAALSGAGGFPAVLIDLGARAVVAPAWSVKDTIAHEIATQFYRQVEENPGKPLAAILQEIRKSAYQQGEDTYAAYCFYGDPFATRQFK